MIEPIIELGSRMVALAHQNRINLAIFVTALSLTLLLLAGSDKNPYNMTVQQRTQWVSWSRWAFRGIYFAGWLAVLATFQWGSAYLLVPMCIAAVIGAIGGLIVSWYFDSRMQNMLWATVLVGSLATLTFAISLLTAKGTPTRARLNGIEHDFTVLTVIGMLLVVIGFLLYICNATFRGGAESTAKSIAKSMERKPKPLPVPADRRDTDVFPATRREGEERWRTSQTGDDLLEEPAFAAAPSPLVSPLRRDDKAQRPYVADGEQTDD